MPQNLQMGIVGLGRIGGNLAVQAREKGISVAGFDPGGWREELTTAGVKRLGALADFRSTLQAPRVVFLYVPSGATVDQLIAGLRNVLEKGDVIVDGGNSYWRDSMRRHEELKKAGLDFVDLGTSGGLSGARHGACFMAGGEDDAVAKVEPFLKTLCEPGGYVHAGPPGAGHFTKLVHNGIEFGMLQAIGEGMNLLEEFHDRLPIENILAAWKKGSVIRSWLIDLMEAAYRQEGGMENIPGYIEDTGEVNWLLGDALDMEVPIPVISTSIMQLFTSRDTQKYWARAVAMMRHGFGGHPYGELDSLKAFRKISRTGGYPMIAGPHRVH